MRSILLVAAFIAAAGPGWTEARQGGGGGSRSGGGRGASGSHGTRSAPSSRAAARSSAGHGIAPAPATGYRPPFHSQGGAGTPFWWGWSWGYYAYAPYATPLYPYRDEEPRRPAVELSLSAGPARASWSGDRATQAAGGVAAFIDSDRFGLSIGVDGFALPPRYTALGSGATLALGTFHATFSLAASQAARLRLEAGGSVVSWPDTAGYAGALALGPDLGISGRLRLAGPLGIEGHARVTPYPRWVADGQLSLFARFGGVAVKGGWRQLGVEGDSIQPRLGFSGPQFGLAFFF